MTAPLPRWEGACAYALPHKDGYEIFVHSSNHVHHVSVAIVPEADRAEQITRRLNGYPVQTRKAYGLL